MVVEKSDPAIIIGLSLHLLLTTLLICIHTVKLCQQKHYLVMEHQWLINQLFWLISFVCWLANALYFFGMVLFLLKGTNRFPVYAIVTIGIAVLGNFVKRNLGRILPILMSFWIFLYINLRFLHKVFDIQHPFLFKKKIQFLAIISVSIVSMWLYSRFAVNCWFPPDTSTLLCEFHMMYDMNQECNLSSFSPKTSELSYKTNIIFEICNTSSIPLLFLYSLGFRYILRKSGKVVAFEKSKEIFGVFQYSPIFVYGIIRLLCAFVHFFYFFGFFVPFDILSFLVVCDSTSVFVYTIPLMFLFTNTNMAKIWKKRFLNVKTNKVSVQIQKIVAENGERRIKMDKSNTNDNENVAE
ncbi:unnamed protein product [Caenorhabditis angaria]|uniref:Uncharacterized protein n=1 Tax=Caenorhabditis angaria TaxID=860376 RepID=A0A9P1N160_9PELO|nr:unnamed protein product [Caenorhabditis angaria]